jgi:hypothetical protein
MCVAQAAGVWLIREDRLIVIVGKEQMERYQTHVFDTVPFTAFQTLF